MKDYRDETWKELKAVVLEELNFYDEVTDEVVLEVIDRVLKAAESGKDYNW